MSTTFHTLTILFALATLGACAGDDDPTDTDGTPVDSDSDSDSDTDDSTTGGETGETGDTAAVTETADTGLPEVIVDCATLSTTPLGSSLLTGARGYHGLVITDAGLIVGTGDGNLVQSDYYGNASVLRPNTGSLEQLEILADGTIIAGSSSDGTLYRIETSGAMVPLASVPSIYGVRLGPDGMIYTANWSQVDRIDPVTGDKEVYLSGPGFSPKVLDFSPDLTKLYIGTIFDGGRVYSVDLDTSFDPIGQPVLFATTSGDWHDGLAVDVCGNLYVAEFNTAAIYRISPTGQVGTLVDVGGAFSANYPHGILFGTGVGGFLEDALYVPQPYNNESVSEIVVGVPYRTWSGTVVNGP